MILIPKPLGGIVGGEVDDEAVDDEEVDDEEVDDEVDGR